MKIVLKKKNTFTVLYFCKTLLHTILLGYHDHAMFVILRERL